MPVFPGTGFIVDIFYRHDSVKLANYSQEGFFFLYNFYCLGFLGSYGTDALKGPADAPGWWGASPCRAHADRHTVWLGTVCCDRLLGPRTYYFHLLDPWWTGRWSHPLTLFFLVDSYCRVLT